MRMMVSNEAAIAPTAAPAVFTASSSSVGTCRAIGNTLGVEVVVLVALPVMLLPVLLLLLLLLVVEVVPVLVMLEVLVLMLLLVLVVVVLLTVLVLQMLLWLLLLLPLRLLAVLPMTCCKYCVNIVAISQWPKSVRRAPSTVGLNCSWCAFLTKWISL